MLQYSSGSVKGELWIGSGTSRARSRLDSECPADPVELLDDSPDEFPQGASPARSRDSGCKESRRFQPHSSNGGRRRVRAFRCSSRTHDRLAALATAGGNSSLFQYARMSSMCGPAASAPTKVFYEPGKRIRMQQVTLDFVATPAQPLQARASNLGYPECPHEHLRRQVQGPGRPSRVPVAGRRNDRVLGPRRCQPLFPVSEKLSVSTLPRSSAKLSAR